MVPEDLKWSFNKKKKLWLPQPQRKRQFGFTGKTLWDWLQLLIIPLFLAGAALTFNIGSSIVSNDQQQEIILQSYFDRMSDLLTSQHLKDPGLGANARVVAQAQTITVLQRLDSGRKGVLIRFLASSGLIYFPSPIIDLSFTNLGGADLSFANLQCAELSNTDLSGADLSGADLDGTVFIGTNLKGANLLDAQFVGADLSMADLSGAWMDETDFDHGLSMKGADLSGATLPNGSMHTINLHPAPSPC